MEVQFTSSGSTNWSLLENSVELSNIIRVASRKMMGDFLQELNAIVVNGGFTTKEKVYDNNILLTNGDQPSTVRSAYLLLHKQGKGDINKKAAVSFITTSQGYLYHDDSTLESMSVISSVKPQSKKRSRDINESVTPNKKPTKGKLKGGKSKKFKRITYKKKLMKTRRRKKTIRYKK